MFKWENIIVQWVNCLHNNPTEYVQSTSELQDANLYYKLINKIKPWNSKEDSKKVLVLQFLRNEYPNVVLDFKSTEFEEFSIATLILSRLSLEPIFHKSLCTNLQSEMQVKVKSILESVYTLGKKITAEDLYKIFSNSENKKIIETPRHVLQEFLNSPAPQTLCKENKIHDQAMKLRHLRADIETLRYEKSELIEDLKLQEKKISELQAKLNESVLEIKMLREESLRSSSVTSSMSLNSSSEVYELKSAESSYEKELHSLEKYISELQNENCALLAEKDHLETDNKAYKSKFLLLEKKNKNNEQIIESVLQQIEKKEDELTELKFRHEELRHYLKEKSKLYSDDQSFECEEVSRILETSSLNKSEVLSSVVEIQLQDAKKELKSTQTKFNLLNSTLTAVSEEYIKFKGKFDVMEKEYANMKQLYDQKCSIQCEEQSTQTFIENRDYCTQTIIQNQENHTQTEIMSLENHTQTEIEMNEQCTQTTHTEIQENCSQTEIIKNSEQCTQTINAKIKEGCSQTECLKIQDNYSQTMLVENHEQETQTNILHSVQFTQTDILNQEQCSQTDFPVQEQYTQTHVSNHECHTQTDTKGNEQHTQTHIPCQDQHIQTHIPSNEQFCQTNSIQNFEQGTQTEDMTAEKREIFSQTDLLNALIEQSVQTYSSSIENKEKNVQTCFETQEQSNQTEKIIKECQEEGIQTEHIIIKIESQNTQTSFIENQENFIQNENIETENQNTQTDEVNAENLYNLVENTRKDELTLEKNEEKKVEIGISTNSTDNMILNYNNNSQELRIKKLLQLFKVLIHEMNLDLTNYFHIHNYDGDLCHEDALTLLSKDKENNIIQVIFDTILENKIKILEKIESMPLPIKKKNDVNLVKSTWESIFKSLYESFQMQKALSFWSNHLELLSEKISNVESKKYLSQSLEIKKELENMYRENVQILSMKLIAASKFATLLNKEQNQKPTEACRDFRSILLALPDFNTNCNGWSKEYIQMKEKVNNLSKKIIELKKLCESEEKIFPKLIKEETVILDSVKNCVQLEKTSNTINEKEIEQKPSTEELLAKQKHQFEDYVKEIHQKYENKLEKMKEKMKAVYNSQITTLKKEQEVATANKLQTLETKLEKQCLNHSEELRKYKKHISELTTQLWDIGEKLIIEKQKKEDFMSKLKEMKVKYDNIEPANKRTNQEDFKQPLTPSETKPNVLSSIENISSTNKMHFVRDFQMMGNAFKTEDEEGEVFDPIYLEDMQNGQSVFPQIDVDRLSVLQMRNAKCKPHLKSSYPTEILNPVCLTEDDIKAGPSTEEIFNDSLSQSLLTGKKVKRKDRTRNGSETPRQSRRFSNIFRKGRLSTGGK